MVGGSCINQSYPFLIEAGHTCNLHAKLASDLMIPLDFLGSWNNPSRARILSARFLILIKNSRDHDALADTFFAVIPVLATIAVLRGKSKESLKLKMRMQGSLTVLMMSAALLDLAHHFSELFYLLVMIYYGLVVTSYPVSYRVMNPLTFMVRQLRDVPLYIQA